jgi:hypothetical protein
MCVRDWERERLPQGYSFLALFLVVIASPTGRGNPVGGVVCAAHGSAGLPRRAVALLAMTGCGCVASAAHGSAGLPRRDFVPPRNDKVCGV